MAAGVAHHHPPPRLTDYWPKEAVFLDNPWTKISYQCPFRWIFLRKISQNAKLQVFQANKSNLPQASELGLTMCEIT
jgi:hypothetical protein